MGGNKKLKISAAEQNVKGNAPKKGSKKAEAVREPLIRLTEKQSLALRIGAAVLVLAAAIAACWYMLSKDFNPDRRPLHGTYIAERSFVIATESGTDLSDSRTLAIVFCEDGRMMYKYDTGSEIHYYTYDEGGEEPYNGVIHQYTDGAWARDIDIIREDNGDMTMHCTYDSLKFSVASLMTYFGEDATRSMLMGIYSEEISNLLMAGDYSSITDVQLKEMGVSRDDLPSLKFSLKNLTSVFRMWKVSDEELSRADAMAVWAERNHVETESAADTISSGDTEE